jgi:DNA-binding MurR/RpiR family transcriptional regulator
VLELPESLQRKVNEHVDELSPAQRRIIEHITESPLRASYQSTAEIARAAGCSKPTVTRLASMLGFSGLVEMRDVLRKSVESQLAPGDRLEQDSRLPLNLRMFVDYHFAVDMENLARTHERLDPGEVGWLADAIVSSRKVYLLGHGIDEAVVRFFANRLRKSLIATEEIYSNTDDAITRLLSCGKGDLIITFDLPRYSRESALILKHALQIGVHTALVTDRMVNPSSAYAEKTFLVSAESVAFTNSLTGMMFFVNVVTSRVMLKREKEALPALRGLEPLEQEIGHYVGRWGVSSNQGAVQTAPVSLAANDKQDYRGGP